jgi:hypothetical protein
MKDASDNTAGYLVPNETSAEGTSYGLWQRVKEWNSPAAATAADSHKSKDNRGAPSASSPEFYQQQRISSDDCSSSGSDGGDSHRSLLTNSSSPLGVFARTSSSVSSLKEYSLSYSDRGNTNSTNNIAAALSRTSLVNMAIHYNEPSLIGSTDAQPTPTTSNKNAHNKSHTHPASSSVSRKRGKPSRTILYLRHRASATNVSILLMGLLLCILAVHRILSLYMNHRRWLNAPITYMQRQCPSPKYDLLRQEEQIKTNKEPSESSLSSSPSICLVTFTDSQSPSWIQRIIRWRNYAGILELTWPNKLAYAEKHGYQLFDHSKYLDISRPPAWSKIPAMQALLQPISTQTDEKDTRDGSSSSKNKIHSNQQHAPCDWVVWTDADTVIMNSNISIADFLPANDTGLDLVVASDEGGGYNSGVLLFRNTDWSRQFLQSWWDMTNYVRPPGFSLSGDNAAMKALLRDLPDFDSHVAVPPRCIMNSFARFLTLRESKHVMETLEEQEWYMNDRFYHKSDFIAHAPGYDNKAECIRLLLQEAE